jgi:hypothetical protein
MKQLLIGKQACTECKIDDKYFYDFEKKFKFAFAYQFLIPNRPC